MEIWQFQRRKGKAYTHHSIDCSRGLIALSHRVWGIVYSRHGFVRASIRMNFRPTLSLLYSIASDGVTKHSKKQWCTRHQTIELGRLWLKHTGMRRRLILTLNCESIMRKRQKNASDGSIQHLGRFAVFLLFQLPWLFICCPVIIRCLLSRICLRNESYSLDRKIWHTNHLKRKMYILVRASLKPPKNWDYFVRLSPIKVIYFEE